MTINHGISPYQAARLLREAEGFAELDLVEDALARVDRLLASGRFRIAALNVKGEILRHIERWREAAPLFQEICRAEPENVEARLALGWCLKRLGNLEGAIAILDQALKEKPHNPLVIYNLACYHSLAGDRERAMDLLREAVWRDLSLRDHARTEPDLEMLHGQVEFEQLIGGA